ncbi:hypothetical protein NEF87_003485 [Candidatus Lokiarchaeum ossiferum]|uniref:DUF998 domain-containing protein n=1 Tax=Candidatus Lokiarchaeum ossiferum TaxID=2951803 RepID=A0ABY6HUK4_9ARCH|nr:hypothetical protein NEF87_003485 [Candidatus Lokiarchaeum sp. B-35]
MISNIIFPILAVLFIVLLVFSIKTMKNTLYLDGTIMIVIIGLIYDTIVVSIGTLLGESELLHTLNFGRFIIHAFFTPLLIPAGITLLNFYRVDRGKSKLIPSYLTWGITIAFIFFGVFTHLLGITLEPRYFDGILYYTQSHTAAKSFPYASVAVVVICIGLGGAIFHESRKHSWYLLAGGIIIFIMSALPASIFGLVFGSLGELVLLFSMVWTFRSIKNEEQEPRSNEKIIPLAI